MLVKKSLIFMIAGLIVAGGPVGFTARRHFQNRTPGASDGPRKPVPASSLKEDYPQGGPGRLPASAAVRSEDTVESLLAADGALLYGRLARWLTTAGEQDIAAYWSGCKGRANRSKDITDLIFLNWARLNPQAAIAASAGSEEERYAWWAWACHDPKRALGAALSANSERVNDVARGIGEFHPEYLREHFKELPEAACNDAILGMITWGDAQNPLDSLKFMKGLGRGADANTLKALVRQDPWAALDWVKQNSGSRNSYDGASAADAMQIVVTTMADECPEDLARLAAQTPSGRLKLKMEAALFDNLLKTDPAAALEQAKATTVPRTAAERYAAIGLSLVKTDPGQAFQLAKDLFTACPDAFDLNARVGHPNGSSNAEIKIAGVREFTESLSDKDPAKALDLTLSLAAEPNGNPAFLFLSDRWAERDLAAYSDWVNRQTNETVRDQGAGKVARQLLIEENYAEAAEWWLSTKDKAFDLDILLVQWKQTGPDQAYEWLEAADLPADQKAQLKATLDSGGQP